MPLGPLNEEGREDWAEYELAIAGSSHVGRVREANQDAFDRFDDPARNEILLVVADGMGGHRGGDTASRMAVGTLGKLVREAEGDGPTRLRLAIERANTEIHRLAGRDSMLRGMGTTVVALLLSPKGPAIVAHVGDSRLYRLRDGELGLLTHDHTLVAKWVREGTLSEEQARDHPSRNQLFQAVGADREIEPALSDLELRAGDLYLLCSDGLSSMLDDSEIRTLVRRSDDPHAVVAWLIDAANQAGGMDNVTAMIASLRPKIEAAD